MDAQHTHTEVSATGQALTLANAQAHSIVKRHVNASGDDVRLATGTGATGAIDMLQRLLGLRVPSNFIGHASVPPSKRPIVLVTQDRRDDGRPRRPLLAD